MNQLGMVVDVAHLAERGVRDVLELSQAPVIASHANCRTVWGQRRNLSDSLIKGIAETGGVIGVTFVPDFVGARGAGLDDLVRHIDHLCELVGDDYIGFGSDFDGTARMLEGIPDVSHYPVLIERLRSMGYTEQSISKICRDNCLRVLQRILK
jgi:membrane dipeptidase